MKNEFDLIDFLLLIRKEFKIILLSIITLFILSFGFVSFQNKSYNLKLIITPLSISEYESIYIKRSNVDLIGTDEINFNDYTPLTIFYSFLKKIENANKQDKIIIKNDYSIKWNFIGGQHEIYLAMTTKNVDTAIDEIKKLVSFSENQLRDEIIFNLEKRKLYYVNDTNQRDLIKENITTLANANNMVNYNFNFLEIKKSAISKKNFYIIFILAGLCLGILIALVKKGISEKNIQ